MAAKLVTECILQGICACLTFNYTNNNVCFGPVPSYQQFATRTDYSVAIQGYVAEAASPLSVPESCQPDLFYLYQRHTIRLPSGSNIDSADEYLPKIQKKLGKHPEQSKICDDDIHGILDWKEPFKHSMSKTVPESGKRVVREQVARLRQRFPTVFESRAPFENMLVDMKTLTGPTRFTAEPFLREWFGDMTFDSVIQKSLTQINDLNAFDETCMKIMEKKGVDVKTDSVEALEASNLFSTFKKNIESRLGFDLKKKELRAMMVQCRFEMVVYGRSPWCAVFSEDDHKFLEMFDDAEEFDLDGFGHHRNPKMACPVAQDILQHIGNLRESDQRLPKAVLHFTHDSAFKKVTSMLGIGRASDIQCAKRGWWSSQISPFNANLNVIHYKCSSGQEDRVAVLLNEKLQKLDGCGDVLCTAQEFKAILKPKADDCNLKQICSS